VFIEARSDGEVACTFPAHPIITTTTTATTAKFISADRER
jgi:hypothetical protein